MKRYALLLFLVCVGLLVGNLDAKDSQPQWKALQVKHFTTMPGVDLPPDQLSHFYYAVRDELAKTNLARQVVGEGDTVLVADAPDAVIVEIKVTSYDRVRPFHNGSLGMEINLYRVSDHRLIRTITQEFRISMNGSPLVGRKLGRPTALEVVKAAKDLPPLASFAPAPSPETNPSATVKFASQSASANAEALTNNSVIEMVAAKLPEEVIVTKIQTSPTNFDVSTAALEELNQKGVSPSVLKAMIMAPKVAPTSVQPTGTAGADIDNPETPGVKHFTIAEGVSFPAWINPQNYLTLLPNEFRTQLAKRNIQVQVVTEGASAPGAGAIVINDSIVVETIVRDVSKGHGSMANPVVITIEINLYRRSDHTLIKTITSKVKAIGTAHTRNLPLHDDQNLATWTASWVANDIKKALK